MRQQTVLILDSQQHRGSMLEGGLTGRDFHVFRTSRSREASKLLNILQPHFVILAWEGEGKDFYQQVVLEGHLGTSRCVVLALPGSYAFRDTDAVVDVRLGSALLLDEIVRAFSSETGKIGVGYGATSRYESDDKTVMSLQPLPSPSSSGQPLSRALREVEQWNDPPTTNRGVSAHGEPSTAPPTSPLNVAYSLAVLAREQASGRVEIRTQKEKCVFYLEKGLVVAVQCSQHIPSFPAWLLQSGILQPGDENLMPELAQAGAPQRLLALHKIKPEQMPLIERMYGEQCLFSCFPWTQGSVQFYRGEACPQEKKFSLPMASLVLKGVRQGYSRERLVEVTGGFSQVPQWLTNDSPEKFFELSDPEKQVLSLIDGHRSLIQIKDLARCSPEVLLGVVYVLVMFGLVRMRDAEPIGTAGGVVEKNTLRVPGQTGAHLVYSANPTPVVPVALGKSHATKTAVPSTGQDAGRADGGNSGSSTFAAHAPVVSFRSMVSPSRHGTMQMRAFAAPPGAGAGGGTVEPHPVAGGLSFAERETIEQKFYQVMVANYFQILDLSPEANEGEIRRAYQQLKHAYARERFANPLAANTEAQLQEIRQVLEEAYAVLSDPPLRSHYITHLANRV